MLAVHRLRHALGPLALVLLAWAWEATAQVVLQGQVIAGGGGRSLSPGTCYQVDGTLGQAATGRQTGAAFALEAGFWATARGDAVFRQGFEECL